MTGTFSCAPARWRLSTPSSPPMMMILMPSSSPSLTTLDLLLGIREHECGHFTAKQWAQRLAHRASSRQAPASRSVVLLGARADGRSSSAHLLRSVRCLRSRSLHHRLAAATAAATTTAAPRAAVDHVSRRPGAPPFHPMSSHRDESARPARDHTPPLGAVIAEVTPFARVTRDHVAARIDRDDALSCAGCTCPCSLTGSCVAGTEPISARPMCVCESIMPGYTNLPRPSISVAPAAPRVRANRCDVAVAKQRHSRSAMRCPVPVMTVPPRMSTYPPSPARLRASTAWRQQKREPRQAHTLAPTPALHSVLRRRDRTRSQQLLAASLPRRDRSIPCRR